MKKIIVGMTAIGMAAALAACGGNTGANDATANDTLPNETVFNDELPADANLTVTDNAPAIDQPALDPLGNGATGNAFGADANANANAF